MGDGSETQVIIPEQMPLPPSTPPPTPASISLPYVDVANFLRHTTEPMLTETPTTKVRAAPRVTGQQELFDFTDAGIENWVAHFTNWSKLAEREILQLARFVQRKGARNLDNIIADVTKRLEGIERSRATAVQSIPAIRGIAQTLRKQMDNQSQLDAQTKLQLEETIEKTQQRIHLASYRIEAYDRVIGGYRRALEILAGPMKTPRQKLDERSTLGLAGALGISIPAFLLGCGVPSALILGLIGLGIGLSIYPSLDTLF